MSRFDNSSNLPFYLVFWLLLALGFRRYFARKLRLAPCIADLHFCCWPKHIHTTTRFSPVSLCPLDTKPFLSFFGTHRMWFVQARVWIVWISRTGLPLPFSCRILPLLLVFFVLFLFCCVILAFELRRDSFGVRGLFHGRVNKACFFRYMTYPYIQI
jgi:hypothetical protein